MLSNHPVENLEEADTSIVCFSNKVQLRPDNKKILESLVSNGI